jgi:hypothetical protein
MLFVASTHLSDPQEQPLGALFDDRQPKPGQDLDGVDSWHFFNAWNFWVFIHPTNIYIYTVYIYICIYIPTESLTFFFLGQRKKPRFFLKTMDII